LPSRWLAHLVGFRHRVVHIFLDPPDLPGYTYVQLRSLAKPNAPGCFDVAVGGHASGCADLDVTVRSEVREELGLDSRSHFTEIECLGAYDYEGFGTDQESINIEHRTVYRAALTPEALCNLRFSDGEVAALCLFRRDDLSTLLEQQPARCASGLLASYALYEQATGPTLRPSERQLSL
jgi:8-oxo-dGTP pyrophosphatase MutT (NUDIX family)